jgi:hypothetical protein
MALPEARITTLARLYTLASTGEVDAQNVFQGEMPLHVGGDAA